MTTFNGQTFKRGVISVIAEVDEHTMRRKWTNKATVSLGVDHGDGRGDCLVICTVKATEDGYEVTQIEHIPQPHNAPCLRQDGR